jgi:phytoene synthase
MRECDDLSDEPGSTVERMRSWSDQLECMLAGRLPQGLVWPALADTIQRYRIPHDYFRDMIRGVTSDLEPREYRTFEELYGYCYRVASVVGMTVVHILGFRDKRALELAEKCGIAFQLTNILRDIREDAALGRVYLPSEDVQRFGANLGVYDARFVELMRFEARRARSYYKESEPLLEMVEPGGRRCLWALMQIYSRLLKRIEQSEYDVLSRRIRVPAWEKVLVVGRALAGPR